MTLGDWFVIAATALYFVASVVFVCQRDYGKALVFFGAGLANIGVLWGSR